MQVDFSGYPDFQGILQYLRARFTPSIFGTNPSIPLPFPLSPALLNSLFPSSSSSSTSTIAGTNNDTTTTTNDNHPSSTTTTTTSIPIQLPLQVDSEVEILHISSQSCWTLVLDKLIDRIRTNSLLTRFQFIFPETVTNRNNNNTNNTNTNNSNALNATVLTGAMGFYSQGSTDSTVMIPVQSTSSKNNNNNEYENGRLQQQGDLIELESWKRPSVEEYAMKVMRCPQKTRMTMDNVE